MGAGIYSIFITLVLALPLTSMTAKADVYRWVDEDGVVQFSDKPKSHPSAEKIELQIDAVHNNPDQEQRLKKQKHLLSVIEEERNINNQKQLEKKNNKEARETNCKTAMKTLNDYLVSGQLFSIDKDGNNIYLSDQEREQEIQKARDAVKYWCK